MGVWSASVAGRVGAVLRSRERGRTMIAGALVLTPM